MELELISEGGIWGPEKVNPLEKWMLDDVEGKCALYTFYYIRTSFLSPIVYMRIEKNDKKTKCIQLYFFIQVHHV